MGITIEQLTEITDARISDYLLVSRGGVYYKIRPAALQGGLLKVTMTITPAQVLAATPLVLVGNFGAATLIEPISVGMFLQYNSVAYAVATHYRVHNSGNTNYMMKTSTSFVQSSASRREGMMKDDGAAANFVLDPNTALVISPNATPTTGDSAIFVSALVRVITF